MPRLALLFLFAIFGAAHAAPELNADGLLDPDKAFQFSVRTLDASTVEVRYAIADGYYLYRDRFRFAAEPASVKLGAAQFPKGVVHEDQFFGKQETYRKEVRIRLPVEAAGAGRVKLTVTSQGCADSGVCYVPYDQSAELRLAAAGGLPSFSDALRGEAPVSRPMQAASAPNDEARFMQLLESGRIWA